MNQNTSIRLIFITFLLGSFLSCEESVVWELTPGENQKLVVDAILTDQGIRQKIWLSKSYDRVNEETPYVNDATVLVTANGTNYEFELDTAQQGLYLSKEPFSVLPDLEYELIIDWQDEQYTANSQLSTVVPIPEITFKPFGNTDSLLQFRDFVPTYNPNQQAMYEMNVNWSHLTNDDSSRARLYFYTFKTADVGQLAPPPKEMVSFPIGSIVLARKFGLNDDFAAYIRGLVLETNWNGGLFYGSSNSLPTNISNGGLGFFTTCAVVSRFVIAE